MERASRKGDCGNRVSRPQGRTDAAGGASARTVGRVTADTRTDREEQEVVIASGNAPVPMEAEENGRSYRYWLHRDLGFWGKRAVFGGGPAAPSALRQGRCAAGAVAVGPLARGGGGPPMSEIDPAVVKRLQARGVWLPGMPRKRWAKPAMRVERMWCVEDGRPDRLDRDSDSGEVPRLVPPNPWDEVIRWMELREAAVDFQFQFFRQADACDSVAFHEWDLLADELKEMLEMCRRWRRDYTPLWERDMARCRVRTLMTRSWCRERDLKVGEQIEDMRLTVRKGRLVQRHRDGGPARPVKLDLWLHVCRLFGRAYGRKAPRKALASYRRIMGRWPGREFEDDGGEVDRRVVDLMRREERWWRRSAARSAAG